MPSEEFTLTAHGDDFDARLAVPDGSAGRGIAVLPGAGHGPWGDIFDRFAEAAAADGAHVLRFDGWPTTSTRRRCEPCMPNSTRPSTACETRAARSWGWSPRASAAASL